MELADAHVAVAVFQQVVAHAADFDGGAGQRDDDGFVGVFARQGQRNRCAGFAAHPFHGIVHAHAVRGFAVDFHDKVAAFHASAFRRRVFNGGNHFHEAVFGTDFHAQTAEFAGRAFAHVLKIFPVHVFGMRVQSGHHAFYRVFQQFGIGLVVHVIGFDLAVHLCHGAQRFDGQGFVGGGVFRVGGETLCADADGNAAECAECV